MSKKIENLYQALFVQNLKNPNKIALVDNDGSYTYAKLLDHVNLFSSDLKNRFKVKKGYRVAIFLPNVAAYAISILAINKLGALAVLVNIRLDINSIGHILRQTSPRLLITTKDLIAKIKKEDLPTGVLAIEKSGEYFSSNNIGVHKFPDNWKNVSFSSLEDIAVIMYTSGTTGIPKGAMMTNNNLLFNCRSCERGFKLSNKEVHLIVVPLFHVTGLNSQLLVSIYMGSTAVLLKSYHTVDVINSLRKYRVSIFIAVPTVFILLLERFSNELNKLKRLKKIGYAGAPMPVKTVLDLKKVLNEIECYNFYGLTETSSIATVLPNKYATKFPDSVGLPTIGVDVKIVDEGGKKLGPGKIGELLIKGGNIIKGYYKNKKATSQAITEGWLRSGDLAKINKKGLVFLMGRKKEIINRGGEKIYPIVLENRLINLSGVLDVAVVGVNDEIFGESVRVCVVKRRGSKLSKRQIMQFAKDNFSEYEMPKEVIFLKELPRNANGKVLKNLLK